MGVGKEGSQAGVSFGQGLKHQGQLLGRQRCRQAVRRSEGTWGRCWDSWHCIRRANCVFPHAKPSDGHVGVFRPRGSADAIIQDIFLESLSLTVYQSWGTSDNVSYGHTPRTGLRVSYVAGAF